MSQYFRSYAQILRKLNKDPIFPIAHFHMTLKLILVVLIPCMHVCTCIYIYKSTMTWLDESSEKNYTGCPLNIYLAIKLFNWTGHHLIIKIEVPLKQPLGMHGDKMA